MVEFILNNEKVKTDKPTGFLLLDLIRYEKSLTGTKIGCREGDCGACTVLIGEVKNGQIHYISATSCLTPIGNIHGKHVVTVEGLNMNDLTPVQQFMVDESGSQCGFCTVGFVVSLSGFCLENTAPTYEQAIASIDGNICRCTGYKSIERAAKSITEALSGKNTNDTIEWLVDNQFIPSYFSSITAQLQEINVETSKTNDTILVGGGTDLYVQQPEELMEEDITSSNGNSNLRFISIENGTCTIGGGSTVTDILESKELCDIIPDLGNYIKLVSSSPIRNISTLAGNFVNASPIGDFTAFFIALNATITLTEKDNHRTIYLKDLYKGYKDLDKTANEIVSKISFSLPSKDTHFNFEKISKREHLDIASVNTAIQITVLDSIISNTHISAGGVGPIPMYLEKTCAFLEGKELTPENIKAASQIIRLEISPISDARGSADYKRLLLRQLFYAHFIKLFPDQITLESLQ